MKRSTGWLSHPLQSLLLAATWLLLQESLAPAQLLTAGVLGLAVPRLLRHLLAGPVRLRSTRAALQLLLRVLWDIVVSNFTVARIVLWPWSRPQPAWIDVPLALEEPAAIVLFAAIITTTPGTVSCVVDEERRRILVHALDCSDAQAAAADMKQRYETLLQEIFE